MESIALKLLNDSVPLYPLSFRKIMNRRQLLLGIGATTAASALLSTSQTLAAATNEFNTTTEKSGPRANYFPNFIVKTHENREVKLYDDLIAGKIIIVNFMYATCEATCPLSVLNLKKVHQALGDKVGEDVHMLSFTIKPEQDTAEKLAEYAQTHKTGKGWTFVTGKPEDIEIIRRKLGFFDPDPSQDVQKGTHIGILRIGNEKLDRWAATPILQSPEAILACLESVKPRGLSLHKPII